jgi:choline monooxygenase
VNRSAPPVFALPPTAYSSWEWYEHEQRDLFPRHWYFAGAITDVPADGVLTIEVGAVAVEVAHTWNGLRARRRDGAAAIAEVWNGFVFVHATPAIAPPLVEWLGELPEHVGGFHADELVEVVRHRFEVACNWKLYVENHIDIYHLWYLHSESLAAYDHPKHSWWDCAPHWAFYEPPRPGVADSAQFARGFPRIDHITSERWGSGAHLAFPNLPFATGAAFFMTYQCIPRSPTHTTIDLRVRAAASGAHDCAEFLAMVSTVLHAEDGAACERIQAALTSPAFSVGPLARELERPIASFHHSLVGAMTT